VDKRIARVCLLAALAFALAPRLALASQWGSGYGDPPGFCPAQSRLPGSYLSLPPTNDPLVGNNPEQDTFFGFHSNPGYDDWYGYWYGDFRGRPGDSSGWLKIGTSHFGQPPLHWNFSTWGWAVHGHAKQYIAYNNWTFAWQCGLADPYMADVDPHPVIDIYVDAVPPADPKPRIAVVSLGSISFSWDPVADRGDGAGADHFAVGMGNYTSWLTVNNGPPIGRSETPNPVLRTATATPIDNVCVYVVAADKLGNATAPQSACGRPAGTPPLPRPPSAVAVRVSPSPVGLAGLASWLWLDPTPSPVMTYETLAGIEYRIVAKPGSADWDFGDGGTLRGAGPGLPYPAESTIQHSYAAQSESGYRVSADVRYAVDWWWRSGSGWLGPYPLGSQTVSARSLQYAVRQAQPELEIAA
jgi:hypothetical protein